MNIIFHKEAKGNQMELVKIPYEDKYFCFKETSRFNVNNLINSLINLIRKRIYEDS